VPILFKDGVVMVTRIQQIRMRDGHWLLPEGQGSLGTFRCFDRLSSPTEDRPDYREIEYCADAVDLPWLLYRGVHHDGLSSRDPS
jgi:hypothetical protein